MLSLLYGPALTRWTFVGKVMPLLFNMLSRFAIAFLPRSKCVSISWLQSPSAVILEPKKIKSVTVSIVSPSTCHEVTGPDAMIFVVWMLSSKKGTSVFTLLYHFHQEALQFLFTFCHKGGVICVSEVIDISPWNLNSSLCFLQPSISHDVLGMQNQSIFRPVKPQRVYLSWTLSRKAIVGCIYQNEGISLKKNWDTGNRDPSLREKLEEFTDDPEMKF